MAHGCFGLPPHGAALAVSNEAEGAQFVERGDIPAR